MKKVALVNRVNYPVTVKYGGKKSIVLPPKKKTKKEFNKDKLSTINPKEILVIN